MNNVRHKERNRWKIVDSVLKASISCAEDQRADPILFTNLSTGNPGQAWKSTYVIGLHQNVYKALISLSYLFAVIFVKASQCFNLFIQMSVERFGKCVYQATKVVRIKLLGKASSRICIKSLEPRCEHSVLLNIAFHDALYPSDLLYIGKEHRLLCIVVMVHRLTPTLAIR